MFNADGKFLLRPIGGAELAWLRWLQESALAHLGIDTYALSSRREYEAQLERQTTGRDRG